MHNWIKRYHVIKSYEHFHLLTTDGRTYLQDILSKVVNGNLTLQIYGFNPRQLTHKAHFNPITLGYPNPKLTLFSLNMAVQIV